MEMPKDPVMLVSYINLKLRDFYNSFDEMCEDMNIDGKEIIEKLATIDYVYDVKTNRFV